MPEGSRRDYNIVRVSSFTSKELGWHERSCIVLVVLKRETQACLSLTKANPLTYIQVTKQVADRVAYRVADRVADQSFLSPAQEVSWAKRGPLSVSVTYSVRLRQATEHVASVRNV